MGFEALLGNRQLKENLSASLKHNHISHFYLICGPEGSGKHTLARLLASAALCRGENKPCGGCSACRKVKDNSHPDFITVDDPEKKTVSVDLVRQARGDMYIQPNESAYKVYLIPRAQDMGVPAQNALLKVLEEPPEYGIFILLADNPEKLLPTVRSRCVELKLSPLPQEELRKALETEFPEAGAEAKQAAAVRSGGFLGQAKKILTEGAEILPQTETFARCYAAGDTVGLLQLLISMEKWKRDAFLQAVNQWIALLTQALSYRAGLPAENAAARQISTSRSPKDVMAAVEELKKCATYAQGNVSVAAICGWLTWALR